MAYTTINKSTAHFNTKLYTGNGSTNAITGVGHQPDMVWIKSRDATYHHRIYDAVRGVTKVIYPNLTNAEGTSANSLTAFGTDGFTLGSETWENNSGTTFASWNWKANGAGSANTDGTINSTVSVNTTAGFSIVKWTGTGSSGTVGHGLGQTPKISFTKSLDNDEDWIVYFTMVDGSMDYMKLNATDASTGSGASFTSTTFSKSDSSGENMIAYCFAEKTGYSKFGKYTGNGNANGTFVYTGFKPAFVMIKRTDAGDNWFMQDGTISPFNVIDDYLLAQSNTASGTNSAVNIDFLSNGFKIRNTDSGFNYSGGTYIYLAFGQSIVGTNNIPATAR